MKPRTKPRTKHSLVIFLYTWGLLFNVEIWPSLRPSSLGVYQGSLDFLSALSLPSIPAIYLHKALNQRKVLWKTKLMADVTSGSLMKLQPCLNCRGRPPLPPVAPQTLSHPYRLPGCWWWEPIRSRWSLLICLPLWVDFSLVDFPISFP